MYVIYIKNNKYVKYVLYTFINKKIYQNNNNNDIHKNNNNHPNSNNRYKTYTKKWTEYKISLCKKSYRK